MKSITALKIIKSEFKPQATIKEIKKNRRELAIFLNPMMQDIANWHLTWESYLTEVYRFVGAKQ